jgi:hypothetical protein
VVAAVPSVVASQGASALLGTMLAAEAQPMATAGHGKATGVAVVGHLAVATVPGHTAAVQPVVAVRSVVVPLVVAVRSVAAMAVAHRQYQQ